MEKVLKDLYIKFIVAIEITAWILFFNIMILNSIFDDIVAYNNLMIIFGVAMYHMLVYDVVLIVKIATKRKEFQNKPKIEEIQMITSCKSCGAEVLDKAGEFCSKCGGPLK
ncbi:hypothetical protein LCGC14_1274150 [marine sediment metagenome]|uniref:Zinc-ribbon domain-containing protein n=1 Tax=marine sediment metagenome TaxID=412755 RepID=A0A0F9LIE9_9ZZZZ